MNSSSSPLASLRSSLPPIVPRTRVGELTGGAIAPQTLANLDSQGRGPAGAFLLGRKLCYRREEFVAWLEARVGGRVRGRVGEQEAA